MTPDAKRRVLLLLVVSLGLLIPGLFAPVLTIRGVLTRDGIAQVAPMMLERGLSDETLAVLKSMMNPSIVGFLEATGSDLRKIVIDKLTPQITAALQKNVSEVEVYSQTRSILGSVRRLVRGRESGTGNAHSPVQRHRAAWKGGTGGMGDVHAQRRPPAPHRPLRRGHRQVVDG